MAFYVKPQREFLVRPALPAIAIANVGAGLQPALELGSQHARACSGGWIAAVESLWQQSCADARTRVASDAGTGRQRSALSLAVRRACERYDSYMQTRTRRRSDKLIAYFSMEYGLTECLPIYSGGLGILSRRSPEGVQRCRSIRWSRSGLLYQKGYHQQWLNPDGWQQERYPINDFYTLPVDAGRKTRMAGLKCQVKLPTGVVYIKVWQIDVGRVKLYLLDTNIPENQRTRIATSPTRSTAAISTRASARKSCSASADCAR